MEFLNMLMMSHELRYNNINIYTAVCEGFYNFSKVCLQFFSFLNVVFFRLFYDITF